MKLCAELSIKNVSPEIFVPHNRVISAKGTKKLKKHFSLRNFFELNEEKERNGHLIFFHVFFLNECG